jgi:septal ring factor EnvC (AmiA/AmiB activator)
MTRPGRALLLLVLLFTGAAPAAPAAADPAGEIDRRRDELRDLKLEIERERAAAEKLKGREKKVLAEVQAADRELAATQRYLRKLAEQERALTARLAQLGLEIEVREGDLGTARGRLARRVRAVYKTGDPTLLEILFSSASLPDLAGRVRFLMLLAEEDRRLMGTIAGARQALVADRGEAERSHAEVLEIQGEKLREEKRLRELRRQREGQIGTLRKQRQTHEAAAQELKEAEQKLTAIIKRLESQRKTEPEFVPLTGPFAQLRGRLPWPSRGQLIGRFGLHTHPTFGTATQNNGIDIGVAAGGPVRAVASGKVDYRDWLAGYGNCVILNHGAGYYTLYAHLSEVLVAVGQEVAAGALIAETGDSGSLKGPMLHFEVRQGSRAMDPLGWLAR